MPRENSKKAWALTDDAFRRLLAWLDEGTDSGGARYLEMRRRLVAYFDRRRCAAPDDLADETLNRVARRLDEEGGSVDASPAHFCYLTARFVLLEALRAPGAGGEMRNLDDLAGSSRWAATLASPEEAPGEEREMLLACLDRCLAALSAPDRDLILGYYSGERRVKIERRRGLAGRLGVSVNALAIRAARIRARLEHCVSGCAEGNERHENRDPVSSR